MNDKQKQIEEIDSLNTTMATIDSNFTIDDEKQEETMDGYIDKFFRDRGQDMYNQSLTKEEYKIMENIMDGLSTPLSLFTIYKKRNSFKEHQMYAYESGLLSNKFNYDLKAVKEKKYNSDIKFHDKIDFARNLIQ